MLRAILDAIIFVVMMVVMIPLVLLLFPVGMA